MSDEGIKRSMMWNLLAGYGGRYEVDESCNVRNGKTKKLLKVYGKRRPYYLLSVDGSDRTEQLYIEDLVKKKEM